MKLHKPSIVVGVLLSVTTAGLVILGSGSASGITWPWSNPKPQPAATTVVSGYVSCSQDVNPNAYPAELDVTAGGKTRTIPFAAAARRFGVIQMTYDWYRVTVPIPAGKSSAPLAWTLKCDSVLGIIPKPGSFTVGRTAMNRTICSYGGFEPCVSAAKEDALGSCAIALVTDGTGSELLDNGQIALDAGGSTLKKFEDAVGKIDPVAGLVLSCKDALAKDDAGAAPPSVATVPTLAAPTYTPIAPLPTVLVPTRAASTSTHPGPATGSTATPGPAGTTTRPATTATTAPPPPPPVTYPQYGVMNTSETPPDGVWFRNSPHTGDTDRVTGHGIYAGDAVQLQCYAWGDSVGPYGDTLWYYVTNLTRPTVPHSGAANVGYLNAHYVNDGKNANQVDAGVPAC